MKQKHLESILSSLPHRVFPNPKIELEQYPTSFQLTSSIVLTAISKNDAGPNRTILDLGCGTGMLGLGFAIANCSSVYLVDCDDEALEMARENVEYLVEEELIGTECDGVDGEGGCLVDTVITNPPFGTKNNEGIDVQFLRTAIRLARRAVYSFHKTSTRPYLIKLIQGWGLNVEVVAEMKFDIPNMYKFHKQKSKDVEVDLIR
ncbi:predicted protein, partial [Thalassiosira pseudonana CCMP1335]